MAKWFKRLLGAGVLAGAAYAVWRAIDQRAQESELTWTPQPFPSPPKPVPSPPRPASPVVAAAPEPVAPEPAGDAWVEPTDGACPASHPVKAKLSSGIFHPPDGQMYERTAADRCYRDPAAAEADGLRASKR